MTEIQQINPLPINPKKPRDKSIDIMKGILVLLMIYCHIMMFFPSGEIDNPFTVFVNLTSFSGFMFCLGYVFPIAYSDKPNAEKRMFIGFVKTIIVFYISGAFSLLLIQKGTGFTNVVDLLLLRNIPGYSEFLISFAYVYLINIFLFKHIKKLVQNKIKFFIILLLTLSFTGFNYGTITSDVFGVLVGSYRFNSFPVIQYGFYFLIGFYLSEKKIVYNTVTLILSAICTLVFVLFVVHFGYYPGRFPPSLSWIIGGFFFVYLYYLLCKAIKSLPPLEIIGKNSLTFLLISNLVLFMLNYAIVEPTIAYLLFHILLLIAIVAGCFLFIYLRDKLIKLVKNEIAKFRELLKADDKNSK